MVLRLRPLSMQKLYHVQVYCTRNKDSGALTLVVQAFLEFQGGHLGTFGLEPAHLSGSGGSRPFFLPWRSSDTPFPQTFLPK